MSWSSLQFFRCLLIEHHSFFGADSPWLIGFYFREIPLGGTTLDSRRACLFEDSRTLTKWLSMFYLAVTTLSIQRMIMAPSFCYHGIQCLRRFSAKFGLAFHTEIYYSLMKVAFGRFSCFKGFARILRWDRGLSSI